MIFKYLLLIFFLPFIKTKQQYAEKQIDSIRENETHSLRKEGKFEEAMMLNMELIRASKQLNYKKGVAYGYLYIANVLSTLGRHEESLRYLNLSEMNEYKAKNPEIKARIFGEYGRNYMALGASEKAIECYDKGISHFRSTNGKNKQLLAFLYHNKAVSLSEHGDMDSALFFLRKASQANPSLFEYSVLAYHHLMVRHNNDSADYYLNKARNLIHTGQHSQYDMTVYLLNRGRLCKNKREYKTALDYYKRSLVISRQIKRAKEIRKSYKLQSEVYELLGNGEKSHECLLKYTQISDSMDLERRKTINILIKKFLEEQEKEYKSTKKRLQYITTGLATFCFSVLFFLLIYYRKNQKERVRLLVKKNAIIKQKEIEKKELERKLNVAFSEVVSLAKKNAPCFLTRFQEVYPEVCKKLLIINPGLVKTELTLCAMIWLNFSSKDIARYTFVQHKTVQVKKYRLRKKIGIPVTEDISLWMRNL
ncbi:tetratricopeptide repeat protein [Sinomicrobium sp. M5D2P9]